MKRMLKPHITEILLNMQYIFLFVFSSGGGVIANEAYLSLKNPNHKKWNNFSAKIILALFVCYLAHTLYKMKGFDPQYEYAFIAVCGFLHYPLSTYLRKEFLPMLGKWIVEAINKGGKKDV